MLLNDRDHVLENVQIRVLRPLDASGFEPQRFEIVDEITSHNLVTTVGKGAIAERMKASPGAAGNPITHMGIGTNATAAAVGNTALGAEVDRNALDSTAVSGAVVTYVATFAAGDPSGTNAITEAGLFSASTSGNMWARVVHGSISKDTSLALQYTWTLTFS